MNSGDERSEAFSYLLLQAAAELFARSPAALDPMERRRSEQQAAKALAIQDRVLASPEAADVCVPKTQLEAAVAAIAGRYAAVEEMEEDLARNGLSAEGLRRVLARDLKADAVIAKVTAKAAQVTDDEVEIYYEQHRDRFQLPESRSARHILITINDAFPENRRGQALDRAVDLAQELTAHPERFADTARRHSECPTAMEGGRLGRVVAGKLYPEVERALFALPENGVSRPVESPLGFHVLLCETIHPPGPVPLAEVRSRIAELLGERKKRAFLRGWLRPN